ncbi:MAG: hypothetical protein ACI8R4_000255 [Paracoccaceae bacterium]|jgi:hypothetical protein
MQQIMGIFQTSESLSAKKPGTFAHRYPSMIPAGLCLPMFCWGIAGQEFDKTQ